MTLTADRKRIRGPGHRKQVQRHGALVRHPAIGVRSREVHALRSQVRGQVLVRGDLAWDAAREAWDIPLDERLAALVLVTSVDDLVAVGDFARAHGLRIAPRGGEMWAIALLEDTTGRKGGWR
jgi:hypothetical protein